jgi:hypothetical protein
MMAEKITLVGGDWDGSTIEWNGSDIIELIDPPKLAAIAAVSRDQPQHGSSFYRRSIKTSSIFVFQP